MLLQARCTVGQEVALRWGKRSHFDFNFRGVPFIVHSHALAHRSLARNPDNMAATGPPPVRWLIAEVVAGGTLVGSAQAFL